MKPRVDLTAHAIFRHILRFWTVPSALVLLWVFTLYWGERRAFYGSVEGCAWDRWEAWPAHAQPYHVLLIADPQLVDPHTYPGRPWPLSTLTVRYTDRYLRRSYHHLQASLRPDATLFLGDLFDGGREWGTGLSTSPETRYKKYGTDFWMKEYFRFSNIFLRSRPDESAPGRRILASVPGNHDLGFAAGIQSPVRNRFDAFFGPLNRVDIIGNHSFVHLDTVSLSAMDQIDPKTGSSGAGDGTAAATGARTIWQPVEDFLTEAKTVRAKAIQHTCETLFGWKRPRRSLFVPEVLPPDRFASPERDGRPDTRVTSSQFPTIVLSHVPLFRSGTTSCGPMRERGSSIPLQAGYQYQNVLTPLISQDIVKHLTAEEITMIYSGDDHDYCEIEHSEFTGRIREITVKSMSWAMGIRIPGVQLVSLWNPVDVDKAMSGADLSTPRDTVQNRLCLLPDQLGVFIRYGQVLGLTLVVLLIYAWRPPPDARLGEPQGDKPHPLLPVSRDRRHESGSDSSQTSSVQNNDDRHLSTRKAGLGGYGNLPVSSRTSSPSNSPLAPPPSDHHGQYGGSIAWESTRREAGSKSTMARRSRRISRFGAAVWSVAWPACVFYVWLLWNG